MDWMSAKTQLPQDQKIVVICINNSKYHVGYFDKKTKSFHIEDNQFTLDGNEIHWAYIIKP
jgi:predicted acetyltransferase